MVAVNRIQVDKLTTSGWGSEIGRGELETLQAPRGTNKRGSVSHSPDHPLDSVKGLAITAEASGIALSEPVIITNTERTRFCTIFGASSEDWTPTVAGLDVTYSIVCVDDWSKSIAKSIFGGSTVGLCTNGQYFADACSKSKQTRNLQNREWSMMFNFMSKMGQLINHNARVGEYLADTDFCDSQAHDTFCKMLLAKLVNPAAVGELLTSWHSAEESEFKGRTAHSVFQAFTRRNRGRAIWKAAERDGKALDIIDSVASSSRPVLELAPAESASHEVFNSV